MSETENPLGKLNSSFQLGAKILNLLLFKLANALFLLGFLRFSLSVN